MADLSRGLRVTERQDIVLMCYCCGEAVGERFALVSMNAQTERMFVMKADHANRADACYVVHVSQIFPDRGGHDG